MDKKVQPLMIMIMFESNPLKSRILVRRLAVRVRHSPARYRATMHGRLHVIRVIIHLHRPLHRRDGLAISSNVGADVGTLGRYDEEGKHVV